MASYLLKIQAQNIRSTTFSSASSQTKSFLLSFPPPKHQLHNLNLKYGDHVSFFSSPLSQKHRICSLPVLCSLSSPTPPSSKDEAILQAKTSLSKTLEKPLNNPKIAGKFKKLKQPRYLVEIPVMDDSPSSLSQLAVEVFQDLPIKRKGSPVKILLVWSSLPLKEAATEAFGPHSTNNNIENVSISAVDNRTMNSADVAVFLAPEASQLAVTKTVTDSLYPKPVVIFNPRWDFEEENELGGLSGFVRSFEVIYSFMGLEVKGVFSKRKGVIFKCVEDGVVSGEKWAVLVEEEGGDMRVVSRFAARPSIGEVENVLYNVMAVNSPITKSAKFLRDLVSNVTGKK
ncbi:hypothetical protein HS088_TW21G00512 [Tripterygium wilfordii]|uniref:DUF1995 domain-containing protein n=1 Tax=Tripterygium wilfordii TaxID=458696 RepID=A0A7J7C359_TRIWF|nr:uncharacterized protein LOC119989825 [Tripterygium wilfordii]KAF5728365.1 hypothetical protein HS088_TW21G00512 [Tripterygium wilfordii]